jgi:aspartate/glutamate racemase
MSDLLNQIDPLRLFGDYTRVTGVAHTDPESVGDPALVGRRLGLLNGSAWIGLWASYFGRRYLPGVHLVSVGNEAVQIHFMEAHARGEPCPPRANIEAFVRYARDLVDLARVDAVLITCSTMNRAYREVEAALAPAEVPVIQIDRPMMEAAVEGGQPVLVVATHGPTVASTEALLEETAAEMGRPVRYGGATVHDAWERLAEGDITGHNRVLEEAIRSALREDSYGSIVLAQLSMSVFLFDHPDPVASLGVPVLTSGEYGFGKMRQLLVKG